MNEILMQLAEMEKELEKPFPHEDIRKMLINFTSEFSELEDENHIFGDFNTYCMTIAGTLSYVLAGEINRIPQQQIDLLQKSFFDFFKQYRFLEPHIEAYSDFNQEYKNFERARKLLLIFL